MLGYGSVAIWLSVAAVTFATPALGQDITVTLLGTGTLGASQTGPSTLVEAGDQALLFDVGRGAYLRLADAGVTYADIDGVFFSHLHSDYVVGFPDLWLSGWVLTRRADAMPVFGPEGIEGMAVGLGQAYAFDLDIRSNDDGPRLPAPCSMRATSVKRRRYSRPAASVCRRSWWTTVRSGPRWATAWTTTGTPFSFPVTQGSPRT